MSNRIVAKTEEEDSGYRKFRKGHDPRRVVGKGRPKGVQNKVTRELKEAIIVAAELVGSNKKGKDGLPGYLSWLAIKKPEVFGRLLEKLLPLQVLGKADQPVVVEHKFETPEQVANKIKERGLPVPPSLFN